MFLTAFPAQPSRLLLPPLNTGTYADRYKLTNSVITAFVVSFSIPYWLDDISSNIGWVFGGIAFCSAVLVYFVLPETKVSGEYGFHSLESVSLYCQY